MRYLCLLAVALLAADPPPVQLTAAADQRRLLDLLKISALRRGADGRNPNAPNAANYDEAKANPYPQLPDPILSDKKKKITKAAQWWKLRRPEIVEHFDREIYGRMPKVTPAVRWEVTATTNEIEAEIPVVKKTLLGHVDNSAYPQIKVVIQLTLVTPANAKAKVPVVMELGFTNFPRRDTTWQKLVLEKGWGYAILAPTSIQPDNGAGLTQGIIGLVNKGQPRAVDAWGALRAWAWGASRALDYFSTDPAVDATRVGLEGHSRYGKAAVVAMAYDQRFSVAFLSSSGAGGVKLHRRLYGEQVENVAAPNEYHWMAGNYLQFAGPKTAADLPVDSHELIALCAPRPVFISSGDKGDGWVDAKGMFLAGVGAEPVYRLLGKRGLGTAEFPALETALVDGDIAFRQHSAGHTPGPNWPAFLTFAARYWKP
ncbi:MAG: acetylxylan esterase [Acidobacteria bacterium]|nr:acetylxylan esterase [Acidobacteriota bacterium]